MSIVIHNCPFCDHVDVEIDDAGACEYLVSCPECRCSGPVCDDIMAAIAAWNKAPRNFASTLSIGERAA